MRRLASGVSGAVLCLGAAAGCVWAGDEGDSGEGRTGASVSWSPAVEISGFGDFVASYRGDGAGRSFQIGQAEIDLLADLGSRIGAEMAIAYDEEQFTLGAFVVGVTLYERAEGSAGLWGMNAASVSVGQFDVPFGTDWKVYPSFDRKLISVPLVVDGTHGGWNDHGVLGRLSASWGNAAVFAVNDLQFEGTGADGAELTSGGDFAAGGRLGLTPLRSLEVGMSYARSSGNPGAIDQELVGADLQYGFGPFAFKGEYIAHTIRPFFTPTFRNVGFYSQLLFTARRYFIVARYGEFDDAVAPGGALRRIAAGAGWIISEQFELRVEYQRCETLTRNCGLMQAAFAF